MTHPQRPILTALVALMVCVPLFADDWPQWMGPNRDGVSPEKHWDGTRLTVAWRKDIGRGYAGVSIFGERLYAMGNAGGNDVVWCLEAATGKEIWKRTYPLSGGGAGWPGARTTPLVDDGRVTTLSVKGHLTCLDAKRGDVLWQVNTVKTLGAKGGRHGFSCHPVIDGDRLFVELGARRGTVVAFDKKNGKVLWQSGRFRSGHSSPVVRTVRGKRQLIVWTGEALVGMNPADGREFWHYPTRVQYTCNIATPVFSGDRVFISSVYYNRGATLLDLSSGKPKVVWHTRRLRNHCSSSLVHEGHLYGFDGWVDSKKPTRGVLRCLDLRTGRERWSKTGLGTGSLTIAGGRLILLGDRGTLVVAEATHRRFKLIAQKTILSGRCWNMPVLADGRITCRSWEGDLVCIDARKP